MTRLLAFAAVLALAVPSAASAIGITSSTSSSASVTLNGFDQTASFSVSLSVTGQGNAGWNVTAWAANPAHGTDTLGALSVPSAPTAVCTGKGCVEPTTSGISWPVTLGTSSTGAVKIYNAANHTGTGTGATISVPFETAVAASTLAAAYTTTITFAVATGP